MVPLCVIIYLLAERHRRTEFYERLKAEATTSAELLFGKNGQPRVI
ncbi:MAG: hypothetical protein R2822_24100 [Spirosomataceae bacterium]